MTVQVSEVRELIEQVRRNYGIDQNGERHDLEFGIPERYEPILARMEAGGEMTFDEEWSFVDAYRFFCDRHYHANEMNRLLKEAEVRLLQTEQMQAYWDGDAEGQCWMMLPEAVERFVSVCLMAVRIMPEERSYSEFDGKRLATAMEWTLDSAKKHLKKFFGKPDGQTLHRSSSGKHSTANGSCRSLSSWTEHSCLLVSGWDQQAMPPKLKGAD